MTRLIVLHPYGLVAASTEDDIEDLASKDESFDFSVSTWGTSVHEIGGDPARANLLIHANACTCDYRRLGELEVPSSGKLAFLETSGIDAAGLAVRSISVSNHDYDDGECRIEIKANIFNPTPSHICRLTLESRIVGSNGRELETSSSSEELPANDYVTIEDGFWGIKKNRLNGAKIEMSLKVFSSIGTSSMVVATIDREDD